MSGGHKSATVGLRSWRSERTLNATELEELLGAGLKAVAARLQRKDELGAAVVLSHPLMIFGGFFICLNGMKPLR